MRPTRRSFLAGAAAAAGATLLPGCGASPRGRRGADGSKLRLMFVGTGNRGWENLHALAGEEPAVLCDVDRRHLDAAAKKFPAARALADYREVLFDADACGELDGVVISTPDHTHYPAALLALRRGLDVYCEKPLTHTVAQARRLAAAATEHGCVTQMGIQIHANDNYRRVVEAIAAGAVGDVREVVVFVTDRAWAAHGRPRSRSTPEFLSWNLWLGPAERREYAEEYHPMGWRKWWAFGGGTTADMGCHFLDLVHWSLGLVAPHAVRADGPEPDGEGAPEGMRCAYRHRRADGRGELVVRWHCGDDRPVQDLDERGLQDWRNGVLFVGEKGWLCSDYTRHVFGPKALRESWQPPPAALPASPGHHVEWARCIRDRTQPSCAFAYAAPLTETVLLANAAYRGARGAQLQWDASALAFTGPGAAAANALLDVPLRAGFDGKLP